MAAEQGYPTMDKHVAELIIGVLGAPAIRDAGSRTGWPRRATR